MDSKYILSFVEKLTTNQEVIQFYADKLKVLDSKANLHEFTKHSDTLNKCLLIMDYVNDSNERLARDGMLTDKGGMEVIFSYTLDTLIYHILEDRIDDKKLMLSLYGIINKYVMKQCANEKYPKDDLYNELNKALV